MKILLNDSDLAEHLAKSHFLAVFRDRLEPDWDPLYRYISKISKKSQKNGTAFDPDRSAVQQAVSDSMTLWRDEISDHYKKRFRPFVNFLAQNLHRLDPESVWQVVYDSSWNTFVQRIALTIDPAGDLVDRRSYRPSKELLVLRNLIDNEYIIKSRLQNRQPFWFVDSGYTNFLHAQKYWHRLIYNNTHHVKANRKVSFPADRLDRFPVLPRPWRQDGERILVVESSDMHYRLHGDDIESWRDRIKITLRHYTNRPIEFRAKHPDRKTRTNLYHYLSSQDIYCVISDSSAAAVESIWAGIPAITLRPHISADVSRWDLGDINNLYRGDIGNWLCRLSYSQFSFEEMCDGTAIETTRRFYVD